VAVDAAVAGGDEADQLQALLVEDDVVILGQRVAAVERLEDVVVVAKDVGQLEHRHLRDRGRQRRRRDRPHVDCAELDLLHHLTLAAQRSRMMMDDLDLAAGQFGELVDELLGRLRGAVLGRIDVAHRQVLALGLRPAIGSQRSGEQDEAGRQHATAELDHWHFLLPGTAPQHPVVAGCHFP
jgi:hypothetical protein